MPTMTMSYSHPRHRPLRSRPLSSMRKRASQCIICQLTVRSCPCTLYLSRWPRNACAQPFMLQRPRLPTKPIQTQSLLHRLPTRPELALSRMHCRLLNSKPTVIIITITTTISSSSNSKQLRLRCSKLRRLLAVWTRTKLRGT